jgi:hypothetical protein
VNFLLPAAAASAILSLTEINVIEVRRPEEPLAHIRAMVYSGSVEDPPGKEGLAALTSLVMRRGAAGLSRRQIEDRLAAIGATLDVATGKDTTTFSGSVPPRGVDDLREILSVILLKPSFEASELQTARAEQKALIEALRSDLVALTREAFDLFVFRGGPYAHPAAGRIAGLDRITQDDLRSFHREHYRKGNIVVALAGDVGPGLAAGIRKQLAALPDGEPARVPQPVSFLASPRVVLVQSPSSGRSHIAIGHPLNVARAHPDYISLLRALEPLGEDISIGENDSSPRRGQSFLILIETGPAQAAAAAFGGLGRMRDLAAGGGASGTDDTAEKIENRYASRMAPIDGAVFFALRDFLDRMPGFAQRLPASLRLAAPETMRAAAARHIFPDRAAIVAVVPDTEQFIHDMLAQDPGAGSHGPRLTLDDFEILKAEEAIP